MYTGYVRPVSEYGVPVWHGSITDCQSDQLERIQKRACRIIRGSQYESYTDAVEELNLQTLSDRRIQLCYQFAQKCCDSDRYSKWFQGNSKTHQMSLRHDDDDDDDESDWSMTTPDAELTGTKIAPSLFLQICSTNNLLGGCSCLRFWGEGGMLIYCHHVFYFTLVWLNNVCNI